MAVRFDAAADRLTHNGTYPQTSAGWTFTGWVRIQVDRNDWSTFVRLSNSGSTLANIATNSSGTQGPAYYAPLGSVEPILELSSPTTGVWVPVAATRGASGALKTYVKRSGTGSTDVASGSMSPTDNTGIPDQICIGGRGSAEANEWLNGDMCHVRIWSTELTQSEIEAEWASITPVKTSGLHSNWPLYSYGDYTDTVGSKALTAQGSANPSAANGPFLGTKNLCPNPSGKINTTGWVGTLNLTGGSNNQTAGLTRTTGLSAKGFPVDTGFAWTNSSGFARSAQTPVTPGQTYTISFWGIGDETSNNALQTCYIVWYNADGSDNSYNNFGGFNGPFGVGFAAPHRKAMTGTAPSGTVAVGVIVDGNLGCTITGLKVEQGSTAYDYADGDSPGWVWDGTSGLSSSQFSVGGAVSLAGFLAASSGFTGVYGRDRLILGTSAASSGLASDAAVLRAFAGIASTASDSTSTLSVVRAIVDMAGNASAAAALLAELGRDRPFDTKASSADFARATLTVIGANVEVPTFVRLLRPHLTPNIRAVRPMR